MKSRTLKDHLPDGYNMLFLSEPGSAARLRAHLRHIFERVRSRPPGQATQEIPDLGELVEDALRINQAALGRHARPTAERIRIEVSDDGVGIAPELLTRIFQHGFTTREEGHGFGPSFPRHRVSKHVRKRRVLVIDDSEAIHKDFRRVLCPEQQEARNRLDELEAALFGPVPSREGCSAPLFEMDSAFQGQEGLAKVQEAVAAGRPYELVFLDYRMPPGWNGFETLKRLGEVAPSLPVVLCSAYSDYSWGELSREFGGTRRLAELRKPFNHQELQRLVRSLTEP